MPPTEFAHESLSPAARWGEDLQAWAIPEEILARAPENPWVHPPALFKVDDAIGAQTIDTPSFAAARSALHRIRERDGVAGTVLDVGCGGGGSSVGLAPLVREFIGVDEQAKMLANFAAACRDAGVASQTFEGRWPDISLHVPIADVVVCHHVVYNVADIEPFLRALTDHARALVVVELPSSHPTTPFNPLWTRFWGIDRPSAPTAEDFVEVVRSLGVLPSVERFARPPRKRTINTEEYIAFVRRRLCLPASRDNEVAVALDELGPLDMADVVTVWWDVT